MYLWHTGTLNVLEFTFLLWIGSMFGGFLGSLTGLGGGVVLVPLLTIFFKHDQSRPLSELNAQLEKQGFYKAFPRRASRS